MFALFRSGCPPDTTHFLLFHCVVWETSSAFTFIKELIFEYKQQDSMVVSHHYLSASKNFSSIILWRNTTLLYLGRCIEFLNHSTVYTIVHMMETMHCTVLQSITWPSKHTWMYRALCLALGFWWFVYCGTCKINSVISLIWQIHKFNYQALFISLYFRIILEICNVKTCLWALNRGF